METSEDGYDTDMEEDSVEDREPSTIKSKFFKRTDSTLVLGESPQFDII